MKLIELQAHERTYFINPAQITHVEGNDSGRPENIYISVKLTETKASGESDTLVFHGDDALRLFSELRGLRN